MSQFWLKLVSLFKGSGRRVRRRGIIGFLTEAKAAIPELSPTRRLLIKERLYQKIQPESKVRAQALLFEQRLQHPRKKPRDLVDVLVLLARELLILPKVLPRVVFLERLRIRFTSLRTVPVFTALRQATVFILLLVFVGVIALTSFVSQTQPTLAEAARLNIQSGIVKIREAEGTFFVQAQSNTIVRVGDTVRAEENATASLSFVDRSEIKLAARTEVAIKSLEINLDAVEQSSVRMAVINGKVEAKVAKDSDSVAFQIETPTGMVEAKQAEFDVAVDEKTGDTAVTAKNATVAVRATEEETLTAVNEGQTALLASESDIVVTETDALAAVPTEPLPVVAEADKKPPAALPPEPLLADFMSEIDILRIRLSGGLAVVQSGRAVEAKSIAEKVEADLAAMLNRLKVQGVSANYAAEALGLVLQDKFAAEPGLPATLGYLTMIEKMETVLEHYLAAPSFRRGVPALEIVKRQGYRPNAELARLFTVLKAQELADPKIEPVVKELVELVAAEYGAMLVGDASKSHTEQLLVAMADQPLYIPALEKIRFTAPTTVRGLIEVKIAELQKVLQAYAGN